MLCTPPRPSPSPSSCFPASSLLAPLDTSATPGSVRATAPRAAIGLWRYCAEGTPATVRSWPSLPPLLPRSLLADLAPTAQTSPPPHCSIAARSSHPPVKTDPLDCDCDCQRCGRPCRAEQQLKLQLTLLSSTAGRQGTPLGAPPCATALSSSRERRLGAAAPSGSSHCSRAWTTCRLESVLASRSSRTSSRSPPSGLLCSAAPYARARGSWAPPTAPLGSCEGGGTSARASRGALSFSMAR